MSVISDDELPFDEWDDPEDDMALAARWANERERYESTDLLNFEQVVAWFNVAPRTVERMNLAWSRPVRDGRLRRILFRDVLAHVERRKE